MKWFARSQSHSRNSLNQTPLSGLISPGPGVNSGVCGRFKCLSRLYRRGFGQDLNLDNSPRRSKTFVGTKSKIVPMNRVTLEFRKQIFVLQFLLQSVTVKNKLKSSGFFPSRWKKRNRLIKSEMDVHCSILRIHFPTN